MYHKITKEQLFIFLIILSALILFNSFDFGYTGLVSRHVDNNVDDYRFFQSLFSGGITGAVVDCSGIIYDPRFDTEEERAQKKQACEALGDGTVCSWNGFTDTCASIGEFGDTPTPGGGSCNTDGVCINDLDRCPSGDADCPCSIWNPYSSICKDTATCTFYGGQVIQSSDNLGVCCDITSCIAPDESSPVAQDINCNQWSGNQGVCDKNYPYCDFQFVKTTHKVDGNEEPVINPVTHYPEVRTKCVRTNVALGDTRPPIGGCAAYNTNKALCVSTSGCQYHENTVVDDQGSPIYVNRLPVTVGICSGTPGVESSGIPQTPTQFQVSLSGAVVTLTWKDPGNEVTGGVVGNFADTKINFVTGFASIGGFWDSIVEFFKDLFGSGVRGVGIDNVFYYVERSVDNDNFGDPQTLAVLSIEQASCSNSGCSYTNTLSDSGTYYYRIRTGNTNERSTSLFSPYTSIKSVTYQGAGIPNPSSYVGNLDSVACDYISGWFVDNSNPTQIQGVDLYIDGNLHSTYTMSTDRQDVCNVNNLGSRAETSTGECVHGFTFLLPLDIYDNQAHELSVHVNGDSSAPITINGSQDQFQSQTITCPQPTYPGWTYIGRLEDVSCTKIIGWMIDTQSPTQGALSYELLVDGAVHSMGNSGKSRPDLCNVIGSKYDTGNGFCSHGIDIDFPVDLKDGASHDISLRAVEVNGRSGSPDILAYGSDFKIQPQKITCQAVAVPVQIQDIAVDGDTSVPYSTNSVTPVITFDTDVDADCRVSDTDESYEDMTDTKDCTVGQGDKDHGCTSPLLSQGSEVVHIACINLETSTGHTAENNADVDIEITSPPPVITIKDVDGDAGDDNDPTRPYLTNSVTPVITFDTDVDADCRVSDTDESYEDMTDTKDCTVGQGDKDHGCIINLVEEGEYPVYLACEDAATLVSNTNGFVVTIKIDRTPGGLV